MRTNRGENGGSTGSGNGREREWLSEPNCWTSKTPSACRLTVWRHSISLNLEVFIPRTYPCEHMSYRSSYDRH